MIEIPWFTRAKKTTSWLFRKLRTSSKEAQRIALAAAEATLKIGNTLERWEPEDLTLLQDAQELVVSAQSLGAGYVVGADKLEAVRLALLGANISLGVADNQFDTRWKERYRPWVEQLVQTLKARRLAGFEPST